MAMLNFLRRAAQRATTATPRRVNAATTTSQPRRAIAQQQCASVASLFTSPSLRTVSAKPPTTPIHMTNDITGVLAGVAVVGALIGVGKMWWDASSSPASAPGGKAAPIQDISREDIAQFFTDLKASIEQLFTKLPELDAAFREHLKTQNIQMGEEQYKQTLLQQLFDVLQNIEQQVVGARGWNQESFALALERYAEDEEIVRLQAELQQVMHKVFPPPEIPDHLTPEKVLEILTVLTKGMETAMSEMLAHARAEGITDPAKAMEEFSQIYLDQVEQLTHEQMKKNDVSNDIFNLVLQKFYGENAEFRKQVEKLYEQQANAFRRLGLDVGAN